MNVRDLLALARRRLVYDPSSGDLAWAAVPENRFAGQTAGCRRASGYIQISLGGRVHRAHRLIWLMTYGSMPADEIDHINGRRDDNRLSNLRAASHAENARNRCVSRTNRLGQRGVVFDARHGRYEANIYHLGKRIYLGRFATKTAAAAVYADRARELFGDFHGLDRERVPDRLEKEAALLGGDA